jgi:hypothetical protein
VVYYEEPVLRESSGERFEEYCRVGVDIRRLGK